MELVGLVFFSIVVDFWFWYWGWLVFLLCFDQMSVLFPLLEAVSFIRESPGNFQELLLHQQVVCFPPVTWGGAAP